MDNYTQAKTRVLWEKISLRHAAEGVAGAPSIPLAR
jgi:hypothetical protein